MNTRRPEGGNLPRRLRRRVVTRDDGVGYGRPPRAHQFKPGRSGNPRGRPKGTKNEATILRDLLNRKINVREGGTLAQDLNLGSDPAAIHRRCPEGQCEDRGFSFQSLRDDQHNRVSVQQRHQRRRSQGSGCVCSAPRSKAQTQKGTLMTTSERAVVNAILRTDLGVFSERCFNILNPGTTFIPNWHIDALTYELERVRRGENLRLIICMPPRSLKSLLCSVAFPAFCTRS